MSIKTSIKTILNRIFGKTVTEYHHNENKMNTNREKKKPRKLPTLNGEEEKKKNTIEGK